MAQTSIDHHLSLFKEKQNMRSKISEHTGDLGGTKDSNISLNEKDTWRATTPGNQQNNCMCHRSSKGIMQNTHWRG
jgi:hypothetical protein